MTVELAEALISLAAVAGVSFLFGMVVEHVKHTKDDGEKK